MNGQLKEGVLKVVTIKNQGFIGLDEAMQHGPVEPVAKTTPTAKRPSGGDRKRPSTRVRNAPKAVEAAATAIKKPTNPYEGMVIGLWLSPDLKRMPHGHPTAPYVEGKVRCGPGFIPLHIHGYVDAERGGEGGESIRATFTIYEQMLRPGVHILCMDIFPIPYGTEMTHVVNLVQSNAYKGTGKAVHGDGRWFVELVPVASATAETEQAEMAA